MYVAQGNNPPPYYKQEPSFQPEEDLPPPSANEYYEITPSCMYKCFMMPFPFFCIGCCLSQTTKFYLDNNNRTLTLASYCGYCCCCKQEMTITYDQIIGLELRVAYGVQINNQPAFKVYLANRSGGKQITEAMMLHQARQIEGQVMRLFQKCRIRCNMGGLGNMPMIVMHMG